jgi:monofunctional biosynthetic peptidoglycan transglycosylase
MREKKSKIKQGLKGFLGSILRFIWRMTLRFVVFVVGLILILRVVDPPTWSWRLQRAFDPPPNYPQQPQHHWLSLEQIPPTVLLAVIASEDQRFPHHYGVDLKAIRQALSEVMKGKRLRGASTLTQQTAKNLFLWPERTFSRKLLEVGLALLLELLWDKERILEVYLNIVEFGPGVYGIGAASDYWYHTPAEQLSTHQAACLAAILPNPWQYHAEPPTPYVAKRSQWVERQMTQLGYGWLDSILKGG